MGQILAVAAVVVLLLLVARVRRESWGVPTQTHEREDAPRRGEPWSKESKDRAWTILRWVMTAVGLLMGRVFAEQYGAASGLLRLAGLILAVGAIVAAIRWLSRSANRGDSA